jgi:hypothetical protein
VLEVVEGEGRATVERFGEGAERGLRTRLETTLTYRGGVGEEASRGMYKGWTSLEVPREKSLEESSDSVWFEEECEERDSSSTEVYRDEVDVVGVIICSQLSPSGGCAEAFVAGMDVRSMDGG